MKLPNAYTQRELAAARSLLPRDEPFAAINISFHETYTRVVEQVLAALDPLARHIVNQRASNLLFGDRCRLQEDLLGDAATAEVRKLFPKMRGCPGGGHTAQAE